MAMDPWELNQTVRTGTGMVGVWSPERLAGGTTQDTALARHVAAGAFVPITVGGDGAYRCTVRAGIPDTPLTTRERRYRLAQSQPYLLVTTGPAALGALEAVGGNATQPAVPLPLPSGRHTVRVHLIDWRAEPGAVRQDGTQSPTALPDVVVEISEEPADGVYRSAVRTFDWSPVDPAFATHP